jgi:nitroimidazol reductase NimA-like FMN-containing flavoprotein (pyridoxamine 5'-phosphate oxidase superfamily)
MSFGPMGVEILDRDRCLDLLATVPLGRLGFTAGALPIILPVAFGLLDGDVVFRTVPGSKLEAILRRQIACFEADDFDEVFHTGWSVLVTGRTRVLSDPEELARAEALPLRSWTRHHRGADRFVRLRCDLVTGRWLRSADPVMSA